MNVQQEKWTGIEIGGTKLQVVVSNADGSILRHLRFPIDVASGAAGIQAQLQNAITEIDTNGITAIGVGFGGPVDWKTGCIQTSHQVEGWTQFPLKDWLQERTGAPVFIDNDANVAALAEAVHGAGRNFNPVFYMTIGSGIGGGLILDKKIYHGATPGEVEIGHIRLGKDGTTLESQCSGWAVNKKVRDAINQHPTSLLAQLHKNHSGPEAMLLQPALEKKDPVAKEIINVLGDDLAFSLSHVVHLFHPQTIIIGGGLSLLGAHLLQPVQERLPHYVMNAFLPAPLIQTAALGENVVPVGALELAKQAFRETQNRIV